MTARRSAATAASMIAAPGSSILPSRFAVEPASARGPPALQQLEHLCVARGSAPCSRPAPPRAPGAPAPRGSPGSPPGSSPRRPTRACASSSPPSRAASSCTRCSEPYDQLSSAAVNPSAGLLFQLTITPPAGSIACGCAVCGSKPLPLVVAVAVGRQAEVDARRPDRQAAGGEVGDVAVVGVVQLNANSSWFITCDELLRRVDPALVEVFEGSRADAARGRASSAWSRSRPACPSTVA